MDGRKEPQGQQPAGGARDVCTLRSCGTQGEAWMHFWSLLSAHSPCPAQELFIWQRAEDVSRWYLFLLVFS